MYAGVWATYIAEDGGRWWRETDLRAENHRKPVNNYYSSSFA
jgi:hypothetical protein